MDGAIEWWSENRLVVVMSSLLLETVVAVEKFTDRFIQGTESLSVNSPGGYKLPGRRRNEY